MTEGERPPRVLSVPERQRMAAEPARQALQDYITQVRVESPGPVPDFDPVDGGLEAEILLVLQRPGPTALATGFVSLDLGSATGRNLARALTAAGLPRDQVAVWNLVPWYAPVKQAMRVTELTLGAAQLERLVSLMPRLRVLVSVGAVARRGLAFVRVPPGLVVLTAPHASPSNTAARPETLNLLAEVLRQARDLVGD